MLVLVVIATVLPVRTSNSGNATYPARLRRAPGSHSPLGTNDGRLAMAADFIGKSPASLGVQFCAF
jgi:hypothetical protein